LVRGIPHDACDEEKLNEYFRLVRNRIDYMILFLFDIFREAYPSFHITHLTLAYNIAQLQHVYKRRFVFFVIV
jgi:hypothetical protein